MRLGSIEYNIYDRSVKKIIHTYNKKRGTAYSDSCTFCCSVTRELEREASYHGAELYLLMQELAVKCIYRCGRPADVIAVTLVFPARTEEPELRELIGTLAGVCGEWNASIEEYPDVTVSDASDKIRVFLSGGSVIPGKKEDHTGGDVIMIGASGGSSTAYLARKYETRLKDHFSSDYVRRMQNLPITDRAFWDDVSDTICASDHGICIYPVGEGGIFAALWDLTHELNTGLKIDLKSVPVYQESIEFCNLFDINIYELYSPGCMLVISCNSDDFLVYNEKSAVSVIGHTTTANGCVITNADETRYLDRPAQDEIYKLLSGG